MSGNLQKYQTRNPLVRYVLRNFLKAVASTCKILAPSNILDVGCGEGFVGAHLLAINDWNSRLEYIGMDISYATLKKADEFHKNIDGQFLQGNIYTLPFKDRTFDVVIATEILEHLDEPERGLAEIERVSAHWVLLSVPKEPFFRICNFLRGKNVTRWGNDPEHVQWWSTRGFIRFISTKLKVRQVHVVFPWTFALAEVSWNDFGSDKSGK